MGLWRWVAIVAMVVLAYGASGQPRGVPLPPATPEARDVPYAGVIELEPIQ